MNSPELRKSQIENILKICSCADMIRCDMAHLILNDFIENVSDKYLSNIFVLINRLQNWIGDFLRNNGFARLQEEFWSEAFKQVKKLYPNVQFLAEVYDPWTVRQICLEKLLLLTNANTNRTYFNESDSIGLTIRGYMIY